MSHMTQTCRQLVDESDSNNGGMSHMTQTCRQ